jgi:hypothetical protein
LIPVIFQWFLITDENSVRHGCDMIVKNLRAQNAPAGFLGPKPAMAEIIRSKGPLPHRPNSPGRGILDRADSPLVSPRPRSRLFRKLGTAEVLGDGPYFCEPYIRCMVLRSSHGRSLTARTPKRKTARRPKRRTARNIELYSSAYGIAWKQISPAQKHEQPDIALRLHASIRRQLQKGQPILFLSPPRRLARS